MSFTSQDFAPQRRFEITSLDIEKLKSLSIDEKVVGECKLWTVFFDPKEYNLLIEGETGLHSFPLNGLRKLISFLQQKSIQSN